MQYTFHMKKTFIIMMFCCAGLNCFAQKDIEILNNEKPFGKNLITDKEIRGREFIFSERIEHSYLDTISNCITVQLRGLFMGGSLLKNNGHVILYDLSNKKTKWTKNIDYQNNFIEQHNNFILKGSLQKTYCLDFETGENLWKAQNLIAFVNPWLKTGIGYYPYSPYLTIGDDFEGIDLSNGKTKWKRKINHDYNLNDIFMLNDSIALIVSSGLHSVNLKNGKGWDYNAKTGVPFLREKKTEMISNVLIDSLNIYFASKEKISHLDFNGNILWSTPLPEDLTSGSIIILMDSTLFMINTGSANLNYAIFKQGKPYLAAFEIKTGKNIFLNTVDDKSGKIIESKIRKDEILILYKDKIAKCSINDGSLVSEKYFETGKYGELLGFISNKVFTKIDSTYKSLALSDTVNHYVYTKKNKILKVNNEMTILNEYDSNQFYRYYLHFNKLRFLKKESTTIVIDKNDIIVAKIDVPGIATKIGNKLYFVQEKSLIEVDLKEISIE